MAISEFNKPLRGCKALFAIAGAIAIAVYSLSPTVSAQETTTVTTTTCETVDLSPLGLAWQKKTAHQCVATVSPVSAGTGGKLLVVRVPHQLDGGETAECRARAESLSGDSFLERLRAAHGSNSTPAPCQPLSVVPPANSEVAPAIPPELRNH